MKECEDCEYTEIVDWEQDKKTGKAEPIYWCERYEKECNDIKECEYLLKEIDNE